MSRWFFLRHQACSCYVLRTNVTDWSDEELWRTYIQLSELRVVDVILPTRDGLEIRQRCVTQPSAHQQILLDHLGWRLPGTLTETQM